MGNPCAELLCVTGGPTQQKQHDIEPVEHHGFASSGPGRENNENGDDNHNDEGSHNTKNIATTTNMATTVRTTGTRTTTRTRAGTTTATTTTNPTNQTMQTEKANMTTRTNQTTINKATMAATIGVELTGLSGQGGGHSHTSRQAEPTTSADNAFLTRFA